MYLNTFEVLHGLSSVDISTCLLLYVDLLSMCVECLSGIFVVIRFWTHCWSCRLLFADLPKWEPNPGARLDLNPGPFSGPFPKQEAPDFVAPMVRGEVLQALRAACALACSEPDGAGWEMGSCLGASRSCVLAQMGSARKALRQVF